MIFLFFIFFYFFSLGLWSVYEKLSLWEVFGVSIFLIIVFFEEFGASRGDFDFGILQIVEIIGVSLS